jgi:hypothetical protein
VRASQLNYKRLCSFVFPTAVILSACQQVSASDHLPTDPLTISNNIENYHQIIAVTNQTDTINQIGVAETKLNYAVTESTVFPDEAIAYGSRITKGSSSIPSKKRIYDNAQVAYQQVDNGEWEAAATVGAFFTSIEVIPYDRFVEMTQLFEEKGTISVDDNSYTISYSGVDADIQTELANILQQFPLSDTHYSANVVVDKADKRITDFHLVVEVTNQSSQQKTTQDIKASFSKYNSNIAREFIDK